ncbi:MAG: PduL/EutD family phosphate acyltransferase [Eubacteriales bacterium]|nr:PduL/EutD family phosphate acyltransferase [Eubacteriales bacterium]
MKKTTHIMISNRHIHLNREAVDILFGKDYQLTVKKPLADPIFAANETVTLKGPKGKIDGVRILGPLRNYNQAEILKSDNYVLDINAPVKISGSSGLAPLTVIGPKGEIDFDSVAVVALRHIHFTPEQAAEYGLTKGQMVKVKADGERKLIFDDVMVVFTDGMEAPMMHVDVEEANAAGIRNMDIVEIMP